ncbi:MAG TPA: hypothetical protein VF054_10430 [Micromonosporaceae bacterium]
MHAYALSSTGPVANAWSDVARFVPKFVAFVIILLIGWLVAGVLRKLVDKLLTRVHFDRLVERGGVGRVLAKARYDASSLVALLVYYAVLLFTLELAFGVWGPNPVSTLLSAIVGWLPKAIVAIVIVVVASAIARAVRDVVTGTLGGLSYGRLLGTLAAVFIVGLGVIAALNQIGVATTVTMPVLIAVLATVGGVLVVGVGGGLVRPMQARWERWLGQVEAELPAMRERIRQAPPASQLIAPAEPAPAPVQATAPAPTTPPPTAPAATTAPSDARADGVPAEPERADATAGSRRADTSSAEATQRIQMPNDRYPTSPAETAPLPRVGGDADANRRPRR